MLAGKDVSATISDIEEKLTSGETWKGELRLARKNGSLYDAQLTISPVSDLSGEIIRYVSSQRDITQQKELERMKDLFVADVSHELRTPITNISLYLDLLEKASEDREPHLIEVIREQSRQLSKLVEDILDLSRVTKSRDEALQMTDVDFNLLVEQSVEAHRSLAGVSGVILRKDLQPDLPIIQGDTDLIARIFNNMISNAVRYTKEGEIIVRTFERAGNVGLTVQDNGLGIAEEDLPHIFKRFYRGKNVRQSSFHGTGLGLAIVKEIVDLHGGSVEVQSHINEGSIFTVLLPYDGG